MNELKHTPGPWTARMISNGILSYEDKVEGKLEHTTWYIHKGSDGEIIGTCNYHNSKRGYGWISNLNEANANANLIAASPDLLSALIKFVSYWDNNNDFYLDDNFYNEAKKAINKALNLQS